MNTGRSILILFGGKSSEYDVSLSSVTGVLQNIDRSKYLIHLAGITRDGKFYLYEGGESKIADGTWLDGEKYPLSLCLTSGELIAQKGDGEYRFRPTAVLPMIHGKNCEDGTIQGMFSLVGIPVVGCDCESSAISMDKAATKAVVSTETSIRQADAVVIRREDFHTAGITNAKMMEIFRIGSEKAFGYPLFVKPARAGSSVGVTKVNSAAEFDAALELALREDSKVLVEECIKGREIEVAVLEEHGKYTVAHPAEIDSGDADFYDYDTKYKNNKSTYHLPARISEKAQAEVMVYAEKIFRALDCRGFARVDFFYTDKGEFVFNEINTLPGFTPISMYPKMMQNEGIGYAELIDRLIETV